MKNNCSVCGATNSLKKKVKQMTVQYGNTKLIKELPILECNCCGAKFDDTNADDIRKKALLEVRQNSVVENLEQIEKDISFTELERCFSLPAKTLSKWKNKSKAPSAAASALISLINIFPWLTSVAMNNYDSQISYNIAGKAFFKKVLQDPKISAFYINNPEYESIGLSNSKTDVFVEKNNSTTFTNEINRLVAGGAYVNK